MKKYEMILTLAKVEHLPSGWLWLTLTQADGSPMPEMNPGQFVEVGVDRAHVLLNRPISIFNRTDSTLELLVAPIGQATKVLAEYKEGETLRVIGPLGQGFRQDFTPGSKVLLVGGGVGIAPLYYQACELAKKGVEIEVIFGMRTAPDDAIVDRFNRVCRMSVCTDDGTAGHHGLVTSHPDFAGAWDYVQICGPKPMMKACHKDACSRGIAGEVSLENMMACGLGACLCCVEKTVKGNVCVCKEGPVFKFDQLTW